MRFYLTVLEMMPVFLKNLSPFSHTTRTCQFMRLNEGENARNVHLVYFIITTSSYANIKVTQFYKTSAIYYCIGKYRNVRAGGEFKSLVLAP